MKIREYLKAVKMTQLELARRADMNNENLSRYCRGIAEPTLLTACKIIKASNFMIMPHELLSTEHYKEWNELFCIPGLKKGLK